MHIIRSADYIRMPWKNGGGTMTAIVASPEDADLDSFDWRVGGARVERNGPFSVFPGVDRTMVILSGKGITLHVAGAPDAILTPASAPHDFPGDAPTTSSLVDGPIDNLNIMVRRGAFRCHVERREITDSVSLEAEKDETRLVYLTAGRLVLPDGRILERDDTLVLRSSARLQAQAGTAVAWDIRISRS